MARENFTFYAYYYEALKALKDNQRLRIYDAICAFALDGRESELSGTEKIIFELIKPQIIKNNKRYENGKKGGRKNQNETKTEPNGNQNETKLKSKVLKEDILNEKERSKEKENTFQENNTPLYPPKGSGESKKLFFEKYGQFKRYANGEYPNMDFKKILVEFERSSTLRKTISWKMIQDSYESILAGNFRDNVDNRELGREMLAEREKYYTALRNKEFDRLDGVQKTLLGFEEYAKIDKRLKEIVLEQAKAEAFGDEATLEKVKKEQSLLIAQRREFIEKHGYSEEDLNRKEYCLKCHDTGYTGNGKLCDCYKKRGKSNEMG